MGILSTTFPSKAVCLWAGYSPQRVCHSTTGKKEKNSKATGFPTGLNTGAIQVFGGWIKISGKSCIRLPGKGQVFPKRTRNVPRQNICSTINSR